MVTTYQTIQNRKAREGAATDVEPSACVLSAVSFILKMLVMTWTHRQKLLQNMSEVEPGMSIGIERIVRH